jgi:hypothetical protein
MEASFPERTVTMCGLIFRHGGIGQIYLGRAYDVISLDPRNLKIRHKKILKPVAEKWPVFLIRQAVPNRWTDINH